MSVSSDVVQNKIQSMIGLLQVDATPLAAWALFSFILAIVTVGALGALYLMRWVLLRSVDRLTRQNGYHLMLKAAYEHHVFRWFALLVPGLIIYVSAPAFGLISLPFGIATLFATILRMLAVICMILVCALTLSSFLTAVEARYRHFGIARQYSIKSYIQVAKIVLFSLAVILVFSVLLDKSPAYFLTGLGAMTAVLLLVFKDSILGFVASIQLSVYDMVRIDDWVEMPNYGANGSIIDISLNTVKVKNFDNTIVTIPTYAFLSNGVKNWRGMSESGGRRIKRTFLIDIHSIHFCSSEMLERLLSITALRARLQKMALPSVLQNTTELAGLLNADSRCINNLTLFRFYLEEWLKKHHGMHTGMTFMVRELEAEGKGLPVEVYMFTNTTDWLQYEAIQAEIFDYIYAILPLFKLKGFQHFSGKMQAIRMADSIDFA